MHTHSDVIREHSGSGRLCPFFDCDYVDVGRADEFKQHFNCINNAAAKLERRSSP